jgi:hypothetical protein
MNKRFDKELYKQNDDLAREAVKKALVGTEHSVIDNSKKTGVDLFVYKNGVHVLNIECEIKRVWKTPEFKYLTVQIPCRKEKYAVLEVPTLFVMFNEDQSSYLVIRDLDLLASERKEVPNKYVFKGEMFFQVPVEKVVFNDLTKVLKETLK